MQVIGAIGVIGAVGQNITRKLSRLSVGQSLGDDASSVVKNVFDMQS